MSAQAYDFLSRHIENYSADIPVAGLDIGSRSAKGALLVSGKIHTALYTGGVSVKETSALLLDLLLKQADIRSDSVEYLVNTGQGTTPVALNGIPARAVTEISCHALGAYALNPNTKTVIDVGGQGSRAIKIDPGNGRVLEFVTNDKCAAGTGHFLEKVANILELKLDELGQCALSSDNPAQISSQCVVFAESEVISLRAHGSSRENIAAGIHLATARRINGLLRRIGIESTVLFTGGVAKNRGLRRALEDVLDCRLGESEIDTAFAGAIGAALFANRFAIEQQSLYGAGL
jgi:predicted CoA-substrate-specific enzyme activase